MKWNTEYSFYIVPLADFCGKSHGQIDIHTGRVVEISSNFNWCQNFIYILFYKNILAFLGLSK